MSITLDGTNGITSPAFVSPLPITSASLGTATAGNLEYDGKVPYFTPSGTQRGVVPGMQYYVLNTDYTGSNVNTAQSLFGVGVTLSSSLIVNGVSTLNSNVTLFDSTINVTSNGTGSMTVTYAFDETSCKRDTREFVEALVYDMQYTGNYKLRRAAEFDKTSKNLGELASPPVICSAS